MTGTAFHQHIANIVYDTAQEILVPAAANLATIKIEEKGPNDFVTEIDKAMEAALTERLVAALPGSIVLGEEAAALEPGLIARLLQTDKPLWIVDPLDGTACFINQNGGYGVIVSLLEKGKIVGSWIYDVLTDPVYHLGMMDTMPPLPPQRVTPRGYLGGRIKKTFFGLNLPFDHVDILPVSSMSCTAYRELLLGEVDFIVYGMTQPWDHFAGIRMMEERNMTALQWSGEPYTLTGRNNGLLLARDHDLARKLLDTIVTPVISQIGYPYAEDDSFRYAGV